MCITYVPFPVEQGALLNKTKTPFSINAYETDILHEIKAFTVLESTLGYLWLHETLVLSVIIGLLWTKCNSTG